MRPLIDLHPQFLLAAPCKIVSLVDIERMLKDRGCLIQYLPPRYREDRSLKDIASPGVVAAYANLSDKDRSNPLLARIFLQAKDFPHWKKIPMAAFKERGDWDELFLESRFNGPGGGGIF
jgi:hypothetical protein